MNSKSYFSRRAKQFALNPAVLTNVTSFPKNALVELTNACNHSCVFCKNSDQNRKSTYLDLGTFSNFTKQAVELGLDEVGLYATGEPFMTKGLSEYVRVAKVNGIRRVYLTTNGVLATLEKVKNCVEAGLDSIKFSINAGNRKDYILVHGSDDFDKVLFNVEDIYQWVNDANVPLQLLGSCVLIPPLQGTRSEHQRVFSRYFDDVNYVEAGSQGGQAFDLPFEDSVKRAVFGGIQSNPKPDRPCQLPWSRLHLTAEGYLSACSVDYNLDLVYANIRDADLKDLWNNYIMRELRDKHLSDSLEGTLCDQCMNNRPARYQPLTNVKKELKSDSIRSVEQSKLEKRFINIKILSE